MFNPKILNSKSITQNQNLKNLDSKIWERERETDLWRRWWERGRPARSRAWGERPSELRKTLSSDSSRRDSESPPDSSAAGGSRPGTEGAAEAAEAEARRMSEEEGRSEADPGTDRRASASSVAGPPTPWSSPERPRRRGEQVFFFLLFLPFS